MQEKKIDRAFDLGTWLGRRQAFSVVAGRCSAADAQCVAHSGETIPIVPENASRLTAAIQDLCRQAETAEPAAGPSIQKAIKVCSVSRRRMAGGQDAADRRGIE
jgi:hypothetical protein